MGRSGNHLFTAILPDVGKQSANDAAIFPAGLAGADDRRRVLVKTTGPADRGSDGAWRISTLRRRQRQVKKAFLARTFS
jgi:hypothetical protein